MIPRETPSCRRPSRFLVLGSLLLAACGTPGDREPAVEPADFSASAASAVPSSTPAFPAVADSAGLLDWADSIDMLAGQGGMEERVYATRGDSLVPLTDPTDTAIGGESEVRVLVGEDEKPLRHVEVPVSESGDWGLTLTHYFDPSGRTRVFASEGRFAGGPDCGGGVLRDVRYTLYRADGTPLDEHRAILDDAGQPLSVDACGGHLYDFFSGQPRGSYKALVEEGRAPPL